MARDAAYRAEIERRRTRFEALVPVIGAPQAGRMALALDVQGEFDGDPKTALFAAERRGDKGAVERIRAKCRGTGVW